MTDFELSDDEINRRRKRAREDISGYQFKEKSESELLTELGLENNKFFKDSRECKDRNDTFVLLFQKLNIVKKSSESILTIPTALPIPTNKDEWEEKGHTNVHRLYSDIWGCDTCNYKQDRHFFNRSSCPRNKKE